MDKIENGRNALYYDYRDFEYTIINGSVTGEHFIIYGRDVDELFAYRATGLKPNEISATGLGKVK